MHEHRKAAISADVVEAWFSAARGLAEDRLYEWRSFPGGNETVFSCTDRQTAERAATSLVGPGRAEEPVFRLGLFETALLGWPTPQPCYTQEDSLALTEDLESRGLSAIIPVWDENCPHFPWVTFDRESRKGFVIIRSVVDLPPWMVNAPFSLLLHLVFALQGKRLVHAASLGLDGRGALVVGPGGVGKSATTLSGLLAGLCTAGDDYVALSIWQKPRVLPVYRVLKQDPRGLARFPDVRERTSKLRLNWQGKVEFDAELVRPGCMASSLGIDVILIPRQTGNADTTFAPASSTAAFSALAPSTLMQLPGHGLAGFAGLTRLTRNVPAFYVDLSDDAAEVGARVRRFLTDHRR